MLDDALRPTASRPPTLVLRPVFAALPCLVSALPLTLFVALWGIAFLGGVTGFVLEGLGVATPVWVPFAAWGAAALLGLPPVFVAAGRRTYARTEYRFEEERLAYRDGLFPREERRLSLADVEAIELQRGPLQRRRGLGTVVLVTSGVPRIVRLIDLERPDEVREEVAELVQRCRERALPARSAA